MLFLIHPKGEAQANGLCVKYEYLITTFLRPSAHLFRSFARFQRQQRWDYYSEPVISCKERLGFDNERSHVRQDQQNLRSMQLPIFLSLWRHYNTELPQAERSCADKASQRRKEQLLCVSANAWKAQATASSSFQHTNIYNFFASIHRMYYIPQTLSYKPFIFRYSRLASMTSKRIDRNVEFNTTCCAQRQASLKDRPEVAVKFRDYGARSLLFYCTRVVMNCPKLPKTKPDFSKTQKAIFACAMMILHFKQTFQCYLHLLLTSAP